jgi:uncharacterized protein YbjT (DUF2867 family)
MTTTLVTERLRERGLPVRIAARRAVPPFDWGDRESWAPVLDGVDAVDLTYYPDLTVLSFADAAAEISAASGRAVRYVPVSPAEFAAAAIGQGLPEGEVGALTELFARALGRPATDFADFAREAAATGVWTR